MLKYNKYNNENISINQVIYMDYDKYTGAKCMHNKISIFMY